MSRIAKHHRILARTLATAAVAVLAATAPASASPLAHGKDYVAPTCGGPNEVVVCKPPLKVHPAAADSVVAETCGGPNEIVECPPPVESRSPSGMTAQQG